MKRCVQTDVVFLVMELLTGDEVRSIEAAKHLIADPAQIDPELLERIVLDPGYKPWSKVMSAYVLGFIPLTPGSKHQLVLRKALADADMSIALRTHAAEAIGNLRDEGAASLLEERLLDDHESTRVRKWCIYALAELRSSAATATLSRFASTHPHGILAQELHSVGLNPA